MESDMRSGHNRTLMGGGRLSKLVCHWTLKHTLFSSLLLVLFQPCLLSLRFSVVWLCRLAAGLIPPLLSHSYL